MILNSVEWESFDGFNLANALFIAKLSPRLTLPLCGITNNTKTKDDKRQLTAVFGGSKTGKFLPPQVIYQGKIHRWIPKVKFPDDWDVTFQQNHWSNKGTMTDYIEKILLPYVEGK